MGETGFDGIDPHDATSCALCPGCADRLYRIEGTADTIRADLDRLLPLADLFDNLAADPDGQAPKLLGMLKLVMGRGGG